MYLYPILLNPEGIMYCVVPPVWLYCNPLKISVPAGRAVVVSVKVVPL
jgi:hypothetical protein